MSRHATMHACARCGKPCKAQFQMCYDCFLRESMWNKQPSSAERDTTDEDGYAIDIPSDQYCVTCGREWGTALRKDGKYYCSTCWQIWNS